MAVEVGQQPPEGTGIAVDGFGALALKLGFTLEAFVKFCKGWVLEKVHGVTPC